jgi:hypothetical protein
MTTSLFNRNLGWTGHSRNNYASKSSVR